MRTITKSLKWYDIKKYSELAFGPYEDVTIEKVYKKDIKEKNWALNPGYYHTGLLNFKITFGDDYITDIENDEYLKRHYPDEVKNLREKFNNTIDDNFIYSFELYRMLLKTGIWNEFFLEQASRMFFHIESAKKRTEDGRITQEQYETLKELREKYFVMDSGNILSELWERTPERMAARMKAAKAKAAQAAKNAPHSDKNNFDEIKALNCPTLTFEEENFFERYSGLSKKQKK